LRTVTTLREEGYSDISTQEVLIRTHDIPQPTGSAQLSSITSIVERLQAHESRKEERRLLQMKTAREKSAKLKEREGRADVAETDVATVGEKRGAEESSEATEAKKPRLDPGTLGSTDSPAKTTDALKPTPRARDQSKIEHLQALLAHQPASKSNIAWTEPEPYPPALILTKPASEMRGHTSYLTFATLHPLSIRTEVEPAPLVKTRVDQLKEAEEVASPTEGSGSEYGSEGLEEVMRTMTEEEMMSLAAV
jgi:tRNA (adenine57-N1/adenine58-N1)-methyltransferase